MQARRKWEREAKPGPSWEWGTGSGFQNSPVSMTCTARPGPQLGGTTNGVWICSMRQKGPWRQSVLGHGCRKCLPRVEIFKEPHRSSLSMPEVGGGVDGTGQAGFPDLVPKSFQTRALPRSIFSPLWEKHPG